MKTIKILSFFATILLFSSCEKGIFGNIVVIQNCTGSYLKIDCEHYLICNKEIVDDYEDGAIVNAEVEYISWDDCNNTWAACLMAFEYEGVIELKTISRK